MKRERNRGVREKDKGKREMRHKDGGVERRRGGDIVTRLEGRVKKSLI